MTDKVAGPDGSTLSEELGATVEDATARDAKNCLALSGMLDCAFKAVVESNEPDAIRAEIVALAHSAVELGVAVERKRCAKVAEGAQQLPNAGDDFANGWCSAALQIAQAIRA